MSKVKALPSEYQQFIHLSRYARFNETEKRRETWDETIQRYFDFFESHLEKNHSKSMKQFGKVKEELQNAILNLEVMPSMRCLMASGKALERDAIAAYNCSFITVDTPKAFDEAMFILMNGTGVGFSVERQYISNLPVIPEKLYPSDTTIVVSDSKLGWASSYRELMAMLYAGKIPKWDLSKVRPAGAKLKTFGGRASGPGPLNDLFAFTVETFKNAVGRKLNSIECHDIMCKVGEIVVVGGVRRSALLSLSNSSDDRMRHAKSGNWWEQFGHRALANNSIAYTEKPEIALFMKEWLALVESKSGERGIFNVQAAQKHASSNGRRDGSLVMGTNPCSEILLRNNQFCNLTEIIVRSDDTLEDMKRKATYATILGTMQATLTDFRYINKHWSNNTKEEALLGVSLTGIMDNKLLNGKNGTESLQNTLTELRNHVIEVNRIWAEILGINQATATTCVKPSGTTSQLTNTSSGIHPRYSDYYIRTVRADKKDPLTKFMKEHGFPVEDDVTNPSSTAIFSFPMKSPDGSITREEMNAIEQLELWKTYAASWCEHKPSITVYVREHEWLEVGAWVYKNFNYMSGVSFLPHSNHTYKQAPYQEVTEQEYKDFLSKMPKGVDWDELKKYEAEDNTTVAQELACVSGGCEM